MRKINLKDLPYSDILIELVQKSGSDLVFFAYVCWSEDLSEFIQKYPPFHWEGGFETALKHLWTGGLITIKEVLKHIHGITKRPKLTRFGRHVKKSLGNTAFKEVFMELGQTYLKDSLNLDRVFNQRVDYNSYAHYFKSKKKTKKRISTRKVYSSKDIKYTITKVFSFIITKDKISEKKKKKLYTVIVDISCPYCNEEQNFAITGKTYKKYRKKGNPIIKTCKNCDTQRTHLLRTKFHLNFSKNTIETTQFVGENEISKVNREWLSSDEKGIFDSVLKEITEKNKQKSIEQTRGNNEQRIILEREEGATSQESINTDEEIQENQENHIIQNPISAHDHIAIWMKQHEDREIENLRTLSGEYRFEPIEFEQTNVNTDLFKDIIRYNSFFRLKGKDFEWWVNRYNLLNGKIISHSSKRAMDLLFQLVRVAGRHFNFEVYCKTINRFARWNNHFASQFNATAPRMFKNMIIGLSASGKNYPINTAEELEEYLIYFNMITKLKPVTPKAIADVMTSDFEDEYLTFEQFDNNIDIVLRCIKDDDLLHQLVTRIEDIYKQKKHILVWE